MPMAGCHKSRGKYIVTGVESDEETVDSADFALDDDGNACCHRERLGLARGLGAACVEHE